MPEKTRRSAHDVLVLTAFCLSLLFAGSHASAEEGTSSEASASETHKRLDFESIRQLDELVSLGLTGLALDLLEQEQSRWDAYSANWYSFEHKRINLLVLQNRWKDIIQRVDELTAGAVEGRNINREIAQWFLTQKATASLRINKPQEALAIIRKLIWSQEREYSGELMPLWRRLIIRAYLLADNDEDARRALLRYLIDYEDDDPGWTILRARVLMRTQRYREVINILRDSDDIAARPLRMLAQVFSDHGQVTQTIRLIRRVMSEESLSSSERWAYQYIIYQANRKLGNLSAAIIELEALLAYGDVYSIMGEEFRVDGELLWQLYEDLGEDTANKHQLLMGDYDAWFDLAQSLKQTSLVSARSLYAVTAKHSSSIEKQQQANEALVRLLIGRDNYLELFSQLYLTEGAVAKLDQLSKEIRYYLVGQALKQREIKIAADLMKSLEAAPGDEDAFSWSLKKARVLILSGDYDIGMGELVAAVEAMDELTSEQVDAFLQVVFDLQAVDKHKEALMLFDLLRTDWLDDRHQREILYWKAESWSGMSNHARAAMLYLQSARTVDLTMEDKWAKAARYKAGKELIDAHLLADAETTFNALLAITENAGRKALIVQELQQIELLKNASGEGRQ